MLYDKSFVDEYDEELYKMSADEFAEKSTKHADTDNAYVYGTRMGCCGIHSHMMITMLIITMMRVRMMMIIHIDI